MRRDAQKKGLGSLVSKHGMLAARSRLGPSQFWFVTPVGLFRDGELPEWAGLIEVELAKPRGFWAGVKVEERVRAPRLHNRRFEEGQIERMRRSFYFRYINGLIKASEKERRGQ
ncbi:MAG: hypothetical protein D6781_06925 [Verrucomicrobia bacterium]|nr:MAG: hypothetical protein D6781_06925 [Verrucomicrobiota bacterium]